MGIMTRKIRQFAAYLLYCFGGYVFIFEYFVYHLLNPELTQIQVLIEKWPWIVGGSLAFVIVFKVYPAQQASDEREEVGSDG